MKKVGMHIIGAILLSSLPVNAAAPMKKRRSYNCYSDQKVSGLVKNYKEEVSEYSVHVDGDDNESNTVTFLVKKYFVFKKEIRSLVLTNEIVYVDDSQKPLRLQGREWALAIAPEKKRASLYNMNPDLNEVPMFCLSPQ